MSKVLLDNRIHNDNWFFELDPQLKYLFIFLISNEFCNLCGAYEMPLVLISTYISSTPQKTKELLKGLEPRVFYKNGWVVIPNYQKYNPMRNPNIEKALKKQLADIPEDIKGLLKGLQTLSKESKETETETVKETEQEKVIGMHLPKIDELSDEDFEAISEKYDVPVSFVLSKWDDVINYCHGNNKRYKDFNRVLMSWVKDDAIKIKKEVKNARESNSSIEYFQE